MTEGTSDDAHLAADSEGQENAAGPSAYAPPVQEERRKASDGNSYTYQQFLAYYDEELGTSLWKAAEDTRHMATALPKSTSDDSHLTGDSKQSENKDFAGMGTSDDAHLAGDSKRQATAAGSSGYAPPVQEERRVGIDGNLYTYKEFLEYYGEEWLTIQEWTAAKDTPPPPPPLPPPPTPPPPAAAVNILLTPRTAEQIRRSTNIAGMCKKEMRDLLDATSDSQPRDPNVFAFDIPANVSWKHYIARHAECTRIVGSGITRAQLIFLPEIRDPNRDEQLRLDYVFENLEGVRCQLHPGNKGKDATPIFIQL